MIDILESYNIERPDNKIENRNFPGNITVYKLPELFSFFAMVFGKLKDEKDFMLDRIKQQNNQCSDGHLVKLNDPDSIIDQEQDISFVDKLGLFIAILERCITESGDKAKALNKLHDALLKTKISYEHYSERLGEKETDDSKAFYDFYVCI